MNTVIHAFTAAQRHPAVWCQLGRLPASAAASHRQAVRRPRRAAAGPQVSAMLIRPKALEKLGSRPLLKALWCVPLMLCVCVCVAQGGPGDAGQADRVPGLHRLRLAHHPPHRADAGQHARAALHLHGHAVLAGVPAGQEGSLLSPRGALSRPRPVIQETTSSPPSLPPPLQPLLLPGRLLMSLSACCWWWGVFMSADEVTCTPPLPDPGTPPIISRSGLGAHVQNVQWLFFDVKPHGGSMRAPSFRLQRD